MHGHAVRTELEIRLSTLQFLFVRVVEVGVEDLGVYQYLSPPTATSSAHLLRVGQRTVETLSDDSQVFIHLGIVDVVALVEERKLGNAFPNRAGSLPSPSWSFRPACGAASRRRWPCRDAAAVKCQSRRTEARARDVRTSLRRAAAAGLESIIATLQASR